MPNPKAILANRRALGITIAVAVVALVALTFVLKNSATAEGTIQASETFTVREGPLTISISEPGTIKSREQIVLKCEVEGQTQIISLVDEGTRVNKGDLLVELDASALVDRRVDQQIRVQNVEASYISAREELDVVKSQAQSDVNSARLAYQFAQEDLTKYVEGDYPMELKRAHADIALSESERKRTEETARGSKRLFDSGYMTALEYERDNQLAQKAELELELSRSSLELLEQYTYKRRMTELQSAIEEAKLALERAELKAAADVVQAEAKLAAAKSEFERERDKLVKMDEQIAKTKIYAPTDGLVVYATTADSRGWRGSQEPLDEGQTVRERQDLIYLPTATSMMAEIRVHESNLNKVRPGLGVRITVDALPGQIYTGYISHIAPLPDASSAFMNPNLKVYLTQIVIDGDGSTLRTGMTCEAEIMIEHHEKALYVPVQSIFLVKNKPTAFVVKGKNSYEQREVEIGRDNNRMVHVLAGLKAGERVLLAPPLEIAAKSGEESEVPAGHGAEEFIQPTENIPAPSLPEQTGEAERFQGGGGFQRGFGPPGGEGASNEDRESRRRRFESMTPEEREAMIQERMQNMTPEEREAMQQRMQQGGGFGGGGSGFGGGRGPGEGRGQGEGRGGGRPAEERSGGSEESAAPGQP